MGEIYIYIYPLQEKETGYYLNQLGSFHIFSFSSPRDLTQSSVNLPIDLRITMAWVSSGTHRNVFAIEKISSLMRLEKFLGWLILWDQL